MGDMYSQVWGPSSMEGSVDGPRRGRGSSKKLPPCCDSKDVGQRRVAKRHVGDTEDGEGTGNQRFLIQTQQ